MSAEAVDRLSLWMALRSFPGLDERLRFANCPNISEQNVEELAFLANSTCCRIRPPVTLAIDPLNTSPDTLDTATNVHYAPTFLMRR